MNATARLLLFVLAMLMLGSALVACPPQQPSKPPPNPGHPAPEDLPPDICTSSDIKACKP